MKSDALAGIRQANRRAVGRVQFVKGESGSGSDADLSLSPGYDRSWSKHVEPLILVGLDPPETTELQRRLDRPVLAFETLPRIRVDRGRLLVEHPNIMNTFIPVERVVYHAIFEDDFDFLTALALWGARACRVPSA